jgi:hypothetical protein
MTGGEGAGSFSLSLFQTVNPSTIDIGITKIAQPATSGSGMLAKVQFVCSASKEVRFSIANVTAVDPSGAPIQLDTAGTSVVVSSAPSISPVASAHVRPRVPFWVDVKVGETKAVTGLYGISFKLKCNESFCTYAEGNAAPGEFLGSGQLTFVRTVDQ